MNLRKKIGFYLVASSLFMVVMMAFFTVFYRLVEDLSWLDAFYFTVITTRTVGFGDISPTTTAGKVGTILNALVPATIFMGISLLVLQTFFEWLEQNWIWLLMKQHHDHTIVVAELALLPSIISEHRTDQRPFVIVNPTPRQDLPDVLFDQLGEAEYLAGDPTENAILERAQITKARQILIATDNDTTNLFVLVSARDLNPGITTIVRVNNEETGAKMQAVGADYLLPTGSILGRMLSQAAVNPISHHFLTRLHTHTQDPFIAELQVEPADVGQDVLDRYPRAICVFRDGEYIYRLTGLALHTGDTVLSISLKFDQAAAKQN